MEFEAIYEFTHSDGKVVQGGFVTGMLDAPMAHLLMGLFEFKVIPMTLDLNVSFLAPTRQGKLIAKAEVIQLGKSTAFMSSKLYQEGKVSCYFFFDCSISNYRLEIVAKHRNPKTIHRDIFSIFLWQ